MATSGVRVHIAHSPSRLADGKVYQYVYLRYETWDGSKGRMQPRPLAALGRADRLDDGRVDSLGRFLKEWVRKDSSLPFEALRERFKEIEPAMQIICSRDFGLRFLIEQAWKELGYADAVAELARGSAIAERIEMSIFAMVLVQLVSPMSKRAISQWAGADIFFPEAERLRLKDLYRGMDVLEAGYASVERKVNERLEQLGAKPGELALDTTNVSCWIRYDDEERAAVEAARQERGEAKRAAVVNDPPLRMRGHSKSKRDDLPQVTIEAIMGENKLIVHHATHAGNVSDKTLLAPSAALITQLGYTRVQWAYDAGFNSAEGRQALRAEQFEFVSAEGTARSKVVKKVLATAGRYQPHPEKPEVSFKCVVAEPTEERLTPNGPPAPERLYIIRRNTDEEAFALHRIARHIAAVEAVLSDGTDKEKVNLLTHKTYRRYVRRDARTKDNNGRPAGPVVLDLDAVEHMKHIAGKSVIATDCLEAHPLAADDLYRNLSDLEAIFRQLKSTIEVGPLRHRRANRIEGHVILAIMAQNVGRWLSMKSGMTLERLQFLFRNFRVQEVRMGKATYWECVEPEQEQRLVFERLGYDLPPKRFTVEITSRAAT